MKKKITPTGEQAKIPGDKLMTRKQAIKRSGYMALSAATMMLLLSNPANGQGPVGSPNSRPVAPNNTSPSKTDAIWDD